MVNPSLTVLEAVSIFSSLKEFEHRESYLNYLKENERSLPKDFLVQFFSNQTLVSHINLKRRKVVILGGVICIGVISTYYMSPPIIKFFNGITTILNGYRWQEP